MDEIVRLMVGEAGAVTATHARAGAGDVALRVEGLTRGARVRGVSFEVRAGEILGLAGLVGSGRTETLRAIFGADPPEAGRVRRGDGPPLAIRSPRDAVRAGIGLVPEDRRQQGLLLGQPVRANITLAVLRRLARARWWIDATREAAAADTFRARLDVRGRSLDQPVSELSGGNQQKVVIARWLLRDCDVLLFDEPTRGIDVGAKYEIYLLMNELAAAGKAIVMISSELPEVLGMADRVLVMHEGRITGEITDMSRATQEQIMELAVK
jgi:ABC-type sugar transport system ATPase subunit